MNWSTLSMSWQANFSYHMVGASSNTGVDSIDVPLFTFTIRNKNPKNSDCEMSWLVKTQVRVDRIAVPLFFSTQVRRQSGALPSAAHWWRDQHLIGGGINIILLGEGCGGADWPAWLCHSPSIEQIPVIDGGWGGLLVRYLWVLQWVIQSDCVSVISDRLWWLCHRASSHIDQISLLSSGGWGIQQAKAHWGGSGAQQEEWKCENSSCANVIGEERGRERLWNDNDGFPLELWWQPHTP